MLLMPFLGYAGQALLMLAHTRSCCRGSRLLLDTATMCEMVPRMPSRQVCLNFARP